MKVLILSCKTGGGHNAAAQAIAEHIEKMGGEATVLDYMSLAGKKVSDRVGGCYVELVKHAPAVFGVLYKVGDRVSKMVRRSPVYYANAYMAPFLMKYLEEHQFDAIVMPHLFPAETITYMKRKGEKLPLTMAVATDYTCIPFWKETDCDYYVIPTEEMKAEFCGGCITEEKLLPFGIPVSDKFTETKPPQKEEKEYLIVGGSMGAGQIEKLLKLLAEKKKKEEKITVICGSNRKMKERLKREYGRRKEIEIIGFTNQMPAYYRRAEVLFTKSGGLTSTEAAVSGIGIVHTTPIPGCETKNRNYFVKKKMSISAENVEGQVRAGLSLMHHEKVRQKMRKNQRKYIDGKAAWRIYDFIKEKMEEKNAG